MPLGGLRSCLFENGGNSESAILPARSILHLQDTGSLLSHPMATIFGANPNCNPEISTWSYSKLAISQWVNLDASLANPTIFTAGQGKLSVGFNTAQQPRITAAFTTVGSCVVEGDTIINGMGWVHVYAIIDTTQAVDTDRVKIYINGASEILTLSGTLPALNDTLSTSFGLGVWEDDYLVRHGVGSTNDGNDLHFQNAIFSGILPSIGSVYTGAILDLTGLPGLVALLDGYNVSDFTDRILPMTFIPSFSNPGTYSYSNDIPV